MQAIQIEDLNKRFGKGHRQVTAVNNISFDVHEGEIFSLLGPNGAGKSTTFRILTTLSRPTSGKVNICGYDLLSEPKAVREVIGYVPQSSGAGENATGWENLMFIGRLYHLPKQEVKRRAEELLDRFDLGAAAKRLVRTYSGGMRRRLDLAGGLMNHPQVLLLDEPTAGLDPVNRLRVWDYIEQLNREVGMTILFTTHYLDEADALAHRVAIIDQGGIVAVGEPEALKDQVREDRLTLSVVYAHSVVGSAVVTHEEHERSGRAQLAALSRSVAEFPALEVAKSWLKEQPYVRECNIERASLEVWVEHAQQNTPLIFRGLEARSLQVTSINVSRPTMDDVFLRMTGRSISGKTPTQT